MTAWVVRGGRRGEYEEIFMSEGIAAIHFGLHQSVLNFDSRESLRTQLIHDGRTGRAANQLWNFAYEMAKRRFGCSTPQASSRNDCSGASLRWLRISA